MGEAARRVVALFVADHADRLTLKPPEAADDGGILAEAPIAGEWGEIGDEPLDVVGEMRAALTARHLRLLPRRERRIEVREHLRGFRLELGDLLDDSRRIPARRERLHLVDPRIGVGDRLLET